MRRLPVSIAVLACLAVPPAAQARIPSPEAIFKAWDKNADGALSLSEWTGARRKAELFPVVDTSGDGKISLEEFKIAMAKRKAAQGQ